MRVDRCSRTDHQADDDVVLAPDHLDIDAVLVLENSIRAHDRAMTLGIDRRAACGSEGSLAVTLGRLIDAKVAGRLSKTADGLFATAFGDVWNTNLFAA